MNGAWLVAVLAGCGFRHGTASGPSDSAIDATPDAPPDAAFDAAPDAPPMDIVIEAEDYATKTDTVSMWTPQTTFVGYSGTSYMQCGPGNGTYCPMDSTFPTCSASMRYTFTIVSHATYYLHVRALAVGSSDNSIYYGTDDVPAADAPNFAMDSQWHWITGATTFDLPAGPHSATIWQRECGAKVDALALTTRATYP